MEKFDSTARLEFIPLDANDYWVDWNGNCAVDRPEEVVHVPHGRSHQDLFQSFLRRNDIFADRYDWVPAYHYASVEDYLVRGGEVCRGVTAESVRRQFTLVVPAERDLTVEQIERDLETIEDLFREVHPDRAASALQKRYEIRKVVLEGSAFVRDGVLYAKEGGRHFVDLTQISTTAELSLTRDGLIFLRNELAPPEDGHFSCFYGSWELVDTSPQSRGASGEAVLSLPNGGSIRVNGHISFHNGTPFLGPETGATIEGVYVSGGRWPLGIYLDDDEHDGTYVALDLEGHTLRFKNLAFSEEGDEEEWEYRPQIRLVRGNPFLSVPDRWGSFGFKVNGGVELRLERREKGLIPRVTASVEQGAALRIWNGRHVYRIEDDVALSHEMEIESDSLQSTPFTLALEGLRVVFDGANRRLILPDLAPDWALENKWTAQDFVADPALPSVLQRRIFLTTEVSYIGREVDRSGLSSASLIQLWNSINSVNPTLANSVSHVKLVSPESIERYCTDNAGACAVDLGKKIILPFTFQHGTFAHEAAHTRTYEIEQQQDPSFLPRWNEVAGDVYGDTVKKVETEGGKVRWLWRDNETTGPRHGCVRAYGARSDREDLATLVEAIETKPSFFFFPLLRLPGHPGHDPARYDPRYWRKIELLFQYEFITPGDYLRLWGLQEGA